MSNLHILQLQRWLAMTVVGVERRPGSQVHRCSHVVRRHERTQAEMPDGQPPVVGARCPPGAVAGQRWKGHLDLLGQPGDQGSGRFGVVVPALAPALSSSPTTTVAPGCPRSMSSIWVAPADSLVSLDEAGG